jgi:excisionase family DNA binding protein
MIAASGSIRELADEAGVLTQELLRRLELLAGADVHEDVSYTKYKTLSVILRNGHVTVGSLGRAISSAQSTTSEMVARLEKARLITRTRCPRDGRSVLVELSDRGRQLAERYRRRIHEGYRTLVDKMSPAERDAFVGALKQLEDLLSEEDKAGEAAQAKEAATAPEAAPAKEVAPAKEIAPAKEVASTEKPAPEKEAAPAREAAPRHDTTDKGERQSIRTFSVIQVSQMCRVSNETIRRWIRKHGLPAYNTTGGLAIKILETDLREFSEKLRVYVDWESVDEGD